MKCTKVLARNLKFLMYARNKESFDIAQALEVSIPIVISWTTGKAIPEGKYLDNLAAYFDVTVAALFTE